MRIKLTILALVLLGLSGRVRAEFKAYWYVLHDTKKGTYQDYYGGIDPKTYQGILPDHLVIENIYECVIMGNTSGIPEKEVKKLVRDQFRKETYQIYAKYDPGNNPYVKIAKFDTLVEYACEFYKLNINYIKAFILKESGANPDHRGAQGEIGLMQIKPQLAMRIIKEQNLAGFTLDKVYEPGWNIAFGCYYLHQLSQEFGRDADKIIAAYHTSIDNVKKNKGKPFPPELQLYVNRVKYLAFIFDSFPQPGDKARKVVR